LFVFFSSELKFRVRAGKKRFLDVWPVNFLTAEDTDVTDNTSLFLFQLACIVNMVSFLLSYLLGYTWSLSSDDPIRIS
jgi:hypothetical protein